MTQPTPGPGRNPITASEFDKGGVTDQPEPRCGNCRFLVADHSHPNTDGGRVTHQRGWVCVGFLMCEPENIVFSGWPEDGMCELHVFRAVESAD